MTESDIRPGEVVIDLPEAHDATIRFIGRIETPWSTRADCPKRGDREAGPACRVIVDPIFAPALKGIAPGASLEIYYWLHQSRRDLLEQSKRGDGQTTGTFALRSPVRPNPIGVSRVTLGSIDGNTLTVRGLDCLDGTPLIDIKPDVCPHAP